VSDNGNGFDPEVLLGGRHYGLQGMRDRVEVIGGRFRLRSAPGAGAMIGIEVPVAAGEG
jgi:signal transduction histidine kinase